MNHGSDCGYRQLRAEPPKVSVIVPIFNKAAYLGDCLDSILNQTLQDLEIICVDDASVDETPGILAAFSEREPRIRVYRNAVNLGPGPARNIGIDHARGTYVQFTDADDLLLPMALNSLYRLAESTGCAVVRAGLGLFPEGFSSWHQQHCTGLTPPERRQFDFAQEPRLSLPWLHTSYLFLRKFILDNAIRFPDLRDGEDPIFVASALVKTERVSTTSELCYLYRLDRPYDRATVAHTFNILASIRQVKAIYLLRHASVWAETCSPFFLRIAGDLLQRPMTPSERLAAADLVSQIWSTEEIASARISPSAEFGKRSRETTECGGRRKS